MIAPSSIPSIDVIVPVHTDTRPIRRAVSNVVSSEHAGTRAVVVCHNMNSEAIAEHLSGMDSSRLTLLEYHDGIHSPAGPMNAGVRASTADYVAFLGSDDEYETGALDAWVSELSDQTDLLIGQFKTETGGRILAPAPRVGRFSALDAARDMLFYRTPPVAMLIRRDLLALPQCPGFVEGIPNGEDLAITAFLYSHAATIGYSRCDAGYFVWEGGGDRVTALSYPLNELLLPVNDLLERPWVEELDRTKRVALATKLLRINVIEHCRARARTEGLSEDDIDAARRTIESLDRYATGCLGRLSVKDARVAEAIKAGDVAAVRNLLNPESRVSLWARVAPQRIRHLLASDGMLRRMVRIVLVPRTLRSPDRLKRMRKSR